MLKTVLWIAAACAAVLLALAVSRWMAFDRPLAPPPEPPAPVVVEAPPPPVAEPSPPVEAKPAPTPEDIQVQEDAAATGMTTLEPEEPPKE